MKSNIHLNIDQIPKELRIILEIVKEDTKSLQLFQKNIDWKLFLELAMHHRIYPILFRDIKKVNESHIPDFVVQVINHSYRRNTFYMLKLSGEMEEVCKLFNENHIPVLTLKGPILGADLYGDISLRTSGDLDVLIPIHDLEKADNLLIKQGYEKDDYIKTVLNDWKWRHHHITYIHPEKGIKLEIHWRLNPGPGKEPSFNELWERKRKSSLTNYPVYYLGKEDLFLFLVSHGARHGWSRLRWLVDIDRLVRQKVDWRLLFQLLKKYHFLHIGGQAIVLIKSLLNTPITNKLEGLAEGRLPNQLAQDTVFYLERMVNLHTEPVPEDVSIYHKRYLFRLMSKRQKTLFIMSCFYPYPEDAETLPLPRPLHFLYFPLRPFIWAWRRARIHALS